MFRFLVYFLVFSCQNWGIVWIAEGTEDAEDAEGRGECQNWGIVWITEGTEDAEDAEGRGLLSEPGFTKSTVWMPFGIPRDYRISKSRNQRYECHWQNARLAFCM